MSKKSQESEKISSLDGLSRQNSDIFRIQDAIVRILNDGVNRDNINFSSYQYSMIDELLHSMEEKSYIYRLSLADYIDYMDGVKAIVCTDSAYDYLTKKPFTIYPNKFEFIYSLKEIEIGSLVERIREDSVPLHNIVIECRKVFKLGSYSDITVIKNYPIKDKIISVSPIEFQFLQKTCEFHQSGLSLEEMTNTINLIRFINK